MTTTKAVILARGLGSRMRRQDASAVLTESQERDAAAGVKGMISIGRPFLDYIISALADAGIIDVCLVIGPEHALIRDYYGAAATLSRVRVSFAIQQRPLGTADAVLAAEAFAAGDTVLALNSDNYYPVHTLRALAELDESGVAVFERNALIASSNIDAERIAKFSVVEMRPDGMLARIIEKPDAATIAAFGTEIFVGMNSWSFTPDIYDACRRIVPSPRGELEIQDAVQYAVDQLGVPFRVLKFHDGVLDMSSRGDIGSVTERLQHVVPLL